MRRPDYGDATPEDLARALMRPRNAPDERLLSAIGSRYIGRFPTTPATSAVICARLPETAGVMLPRATPARTGSDASG